MAVKRFELLNHCREPVQIKPPIRGRRISSFVRERFELFKTHKLRIDAALSNDMGRADMVSNSVSPRSQGTAGVVAPKAPPQLKVNVLAQVAALFLVRFVGLGQPFE